MPSHCNCSISHSFQALVPSNPMADHSNNLVADHSNNQGHEEGNIILTNPTLEGVIEFLDEVIDSFQDLDPSNSMADHSNNDPMADHSNNQGHEGGNIILMNLTLERLFGELCAEVLQMLHGRKVNVRCVQESLQKDKL